MATTWTLNCTASSGETATLEIVDSLNPLPGSDTWRGVEGEPVWGDPPSGNVANWGSGQTILHAGAATVVHTLDGFTKSTDKNNVGTGSKAPIGGSFPDGSFDWVCTSRK